MAKKIIEFVLDKQEEIKADPQGAGEANAQLAIDAIIEGRKGPGGAYEKYMLQFVEKDFGGNPTDPVGIAQLARLMANDEPVPGENMNRKRAYMLTNAVCGGGSPDNGGRFDFTVPTIDAGLFEEADAQAEAPAAGAGAAAPEAGGASR